MFKGRDGMGAELILGMNLNFVTLLSCSQQRRVAVLRGVCVVRARFFESAARRVLKFRLWRGGSRDFEI
jgi:hypothetical protein